MGQSLQNASWAVGQLAAADAVRLSDRTLAAFGSVLREFPMAQGQLLYSKGEVPPGAWILRTATVELSTYERGKRSIVQLLHPGEVVGDVPVLLAEPSPITVRAADEGTSLFLERDRLRSLLQSQPKLAYLWVQSCATRLHRLRLRVVKFLGGTLPQSLARLLLDELSEGRVSLSQARMAEMLGVQRTSVNRVLKELRLRGVIQSVYAGVVVLDRIELERLAYRVETAGGPPTGA